MARLYEGMFLLDNKVVREDWKQAKAVVVDTLTKHGATVVSARRWDERKLAYTIRGRRRATYFLAYTEITGDAMGAIRRDLELNEKVLRHLFVACPGLPEGEADLAAQEVAEGYVVPAPPADDAVEVEREHGRGRDEPGEGELGEGEDGGDARRERRGRPRAEEQDEAAPKTEES